MAEKEARKKNACHWAQGKAPDADVPYEIPHSENQKQREDGLGTEKFEKTGEGAELFHRLPLRVGEQVRCPVDFPLPLVNIIEASYFRSQPRPILTPDFIGSGGTAEHGGEGQKTGRDGRQGKRERIYSSCAQNDSVLQLSTIAVREQKGELQNADAWESMVHHLHLPLGRPSPKPAALWE
jgi:hypothetical protein